ncbi:adenylate kinase [Methanospirillum sp.]|uniref:adenylate kinase n=1 Tax=Methanospirillum sp. TaxID=45200 RepID=UPI002C77AEAB|nr:adenylate kinase [Methanospirillum sp.]HPP79240.1 adenylate kinase [Methanospirillum sp.]
MTGKKVIITGVPGVGKTSVITESIRRLEEEGVPYQSINFGTFMFDVAQKEGIVNDRDEMRKLDKNTQKRLQQLASQAIARIDGNVIIDTHASVKTPVGFLPGLPECVLKELKPDLIILVETDSDQILKRRLSDTSRIRDIEGYRDIQDHQDFNRAVAASYAMLTGCTIRYIQNPDFLLEKAVEEMVQVLR